MVWIIYILTFYVYDSDTFLPSNKITWIQTRSYFTLNVILNICLISSVIIGERKFKLGNITAFPPNPLLLQMQNKQVNMHKQPIWIEIACASDLWAHHRDVLTEITEIVSVPRQFTFLTMGI